MRALRSLVIAVVSGASVPVGAQSGALVSEYFNYGPNPLAFGGLNGGTQWAAPWSSGATYFPANQSGGVNLYDDTGNLPGGGNATRGVIPPSGRVLRSPTSGTVWVSYLAAVNTGIAIPDVGLALNNQNLSAIGVESTALGLVAWISGPAGVSQSSVVRPRRPAGGQVVVAKIEFDVGGGVEDRITAWLDPVIVARTELGLGAPDISGIVGDIGASLSSVVLLPGPNNGIDALRICSGVLSCDAKVAAVLSGSLFPGSGADLQLLTGVSGATPSAQPQQKAVAPGSAVDVVVESPSGSLVGQALFIAVTPLSAIPPVGPFALHIDASTVFLLQPSPWFTPVIVSGGVRLPFVVPSAVPAGTDLLLQAVAVSFAGPLLIQGSDGHVLEVR